MSETQQSALYMVRVQVEEDGQGVAAEVWARLEDVDAEDLGPRAGMPAWVFPTDASGYCEIRFDPETLENYFGRDGVAQLRLLARTRHGATGSVTQRINNQDPPADLIALRVYSPTSVDTGTPPAPDGDTGSIPPGDGKGPLEVTFTTEVLDAILGGGASVTGSSGATPGVFDDRFFEERLRRLMGANVRAGDVAGLRREIDRVVVEEDVEGEKQFVFRGAGRTSVAKKTAGAAYPTTGGAGYGSMKPGYASSSYASAMSANSHAYTSAGSGYGGVNGGAPTTTNFAGPQAILYRRAIGEFDHARQALASLQPKNQEDSEEFESIRSLVDDGLIDLVTAFGSELRPPVKRVDGTFADLLGEKGTPGTEGFIHQLGRLGEYLGTLAPGAVAGSSNGGGFLTLAEEQEQTRFQELDTYVRGLRDQWFAFRDQFLDQITSPTLNVRGAVLGRRIGYVADAVRELDLALATAPGDPGEREFEPIDSGRTTTLNEYITWLNDFVADGQAQVRDGSTASFIAIGREGGRLADIASDALILAPTGQIEVLKRHLVRRAMEELRDNLDDIKKLGTPIGSQDPTGSQGAQGPQGSPGPQGAQGATGSRGHQGSQGRQGPQGPQGKPGSSVG